MEKLNENKLVEVKSNFLDDAELDIWYDLDLDPDYRGAIKYRKLSKQSILQIYMDLRYVGNVKGSQYFGWLPTHFTPSEGKSIMGFVTYYDGIKNETRKQILNITKKGALEIDGPESSVVKDMMFAGMINL